MDENERFQLFFTLSKVDEAKRLVYGRATQEVPDGAREIMDYETSAPRIRKWSESAVQRSGGKSKGNIREMHEAVAAGKVIDITFNDAEKAVDIGTYCSDDGTWKKILDGTLTGFSLGGKYAKRWPDPRNPSYIRYTAEPSEISYVDRPAVPTATYTLIKADGTQEMRKVVHSLYPEDMEIINNPEAPDAGATPLTAEPAMSGNDVVTIPAPAGVPLPTVSDKEPTGTAPADIDAGDPQNRYSAPIKLESGVSNYVRKFLDGIERIEALRKADAEEKDKLEAELKSRGARVGIARREGAPLTPPKDYPTDPKQYADPANWGYPVDDPRIAAAIGRYNGGGGRENYSPREWMLLGRRIARMAGEVSGNPYEFDPKTKQVTRKEIKKMDKTLAKGTDVGALLADVSGQLKSAVDAIGSDPEKVKDLLLQAVAAIDVATDVGNVDTNTTEPMAPTDAAQVSTMKAAGMETPAAPPMAMAATTPTTATTPSTPSMPSVSSESTKTPSSESETEVFKMLKDIGARLEKLEKPADPAPIAVAPVVEPAIAKADGVPNPVGDLAALLSNVPAPKDEVTEALLKRDIVGAAKAAGGEHQLMDAVNTRVQAAIEKAFEFMPSHEIYNEPVPPAAA